MYPYVILFVMPSGDEKALEIMAYDSDHARAKFLIDHKELANCEILLVAQLTLQEFTMWTGAEVFK